jgi:hypothetical protein
MDGIKILTGYVKHHAVMSNKAVFNINDRGNKNIFSFSLINTNLM